MAKEKDHEVSMAKTQVKKSIDNLQKVARVLAKKSDADNLPAWVQAKITDTAHDTDATASYMTGGDDDVSEQIDARKYFKVVNGKKVPLNPNELLQRMVPEPVIIPKSELQQAHFELEGELLDEKKKGGTLHNWFGKSKSKDGKKGWVQSDGSPCANEPGETKTPKCYSSRRLAGLKKTKEGRKKIRSADARKSAKDPGQQQKSGGAAPTMVRTFTDKKDYKKHKSGDYSAESFEMQEARDVKGKGSGKKDACYHKVKSRYSVWPSAYASGALVKCRKVGAANWGNKTESYNYSNWREDFKALEIETIDLIKAEPLVNKVVSEADTPRGQKPSVGMNITPDMTQPKPKPPTTRQRVRSAGEKYGEQAFKKEMPKFTTESKNCWKGYEKKGTKKMFGKTYNNCVKKEEFSNWRQELSEKYAGQYDKGMPGSKPYGGRETGPVQDPDYLRRRINDIRDSIPVKKASTKKPTQVAHFEPEGELIEDWQKVNKKDKTDGMSQKAVDAYKRENPGSKLKTAVTEKNPGGKRAKRRKSFCARSNGQRKMHNIDCSKTPDKAICKARKRWNC